MKRWWVLSCLVIMAMSGAAEAKDRSPAKAAKAAKAEPVEAEPPPVAEAEAAAPAEPETPRILGPKQVDLGHHAQLDLPEGMMLIEAQAAQELMRKMGNGTDGVVALVLPQSDATWLVVIEADDVGYISDSDADELDAGTMLDQFKQGTAAQNKQRVAAGTSELFVDGWSQAPRYDAAAHHLVWGLNGHDKDSKIINFFTRILGRNGYLSVNLIDDPATIEQSKAEALAVLTALHFGPGFRYEDHADGDHDSGIGLKTLVLGGTAVVLAKKGGILIAILLALKKGFVVIAIALGAFFKRLFGRKKQDEEIHLATTTPPAGAAPPPDGDGDGGGDGSPPGAPTGV